MENLDKMTQEISNQATQIGVLKTEKAALVEANAKLEQELKSIQEAQSKVSGHYEKSLAVLEGLMLKYHNVTSEAQRTKSNYNKSLAIAEGLKKELFAVSENYGKSLRVIQGLQNLTVKDSVSKFVDKELGEGAFEKYKALFEGRSAKTVKAVVKSLKEAQGATPTTGGLIRKKSINEGGIIAQPQLDAEAERRVGLYS